MEINILDWNMIGLEFHWNMMIGKSLENMHWNTLEYMMIGISLEYMKIGRKLEYDKIGKLLEDFNISC